MMTKMLVLIFLVGTASKRPIRRRYVRRHRSFHVVYNAESSNYFAWQVRASYSTYMKQMGSLAHSNYTRLLTMPSLEHDDISK
jgi:hypothetical protein